MHSCRNNCNWNICMRCKDPKKIYQVRLCDDVAEVKEFVKTVTEGKLEMDPKGAYSVCVAVTYMDLKWGVTGKPGNKMDFQSLGEKQRDVSTFELASHSSRGAECFEYKTDNIDAAKLPFSQPNSGSDLVELIAIMPKDITTSVGQWALKNRDVIERLVLRHDDWKPAGDMDFTFPELEFEREIKNLKDRYKTLGIPAKNVELPNTEYSTKAKLKMSQEGLTFAAAALRQISRSCPCGAAIPRGKLQFNSSFMLYLIVRPRAPCQYCNENGDKSDSSLEDENCRKCQNGYVDDASRSVKIMMTANIEKVEKTSPRE